jgi:hypothetical protein
LKIAVFAIAGALFLLAGCATKTTENENKCAQGASADCPQGTPARTESDYRKETSSLDAARCRSIAGDSGDEYRKCLARYEKDRR